MVFCTRVSPDVLYPPYAPLDSLGPVFPHGPSSQARRAISVTHPFQVANLALVLHPVPALRVPSLPSLHRVQEHRSVLATRIPQVVLAILRVLLFYAVAVHHLRPCFQ
jgi:hypothetical protein